MVDVAEELGSKDDGAWRVGGRYLCSIGEKWSKKMALLRMDRWPMAFAMA